jgi:hypothetical protein
VKLATITPVNVHYWKRRFIARAGDDPMKQRAARISFNLFVRQTESLFAPELVKHLDTVQLPDPLTFTGIKFEPRLEKIENQTSQLQEREERYDGGENLRSRRAKSKGATAFFSKYQTEYRAMLDSDLWLRQQLWQQLWKGPGAISSYLSIPTAWDYCASLSRKAAVVSKKSPSIKGG